jgi:hypothetical protein
MNVERLRERLLAAARAHPPAEAVPYAFEKRVMARLRELPAGDAWAYWSTALWRAAAPCVAVMLLLGIWTAATSRANGSLESHATDLERTVLAPLDYVGESW